METKYVIKGSVKDISPDDDMAYFVGIMGDVTWGNEKFELKQFSVSIKGATKYNSYQEALDVIQDNELHGFDAYPVCPKCHKDYDDPPAISRRDNKTEICSKCGQQEALNDFFGYLKKQKRR